MKLIVSRDEARGIESGNITILYRRCASPALALSRYRPGDVAWVAEPIFKARCVGNGKRRDFFSADVLPKNWERISEDRCGYRIVKSESRNNVRIVGWDAATKPDPFDGHVMIRLKVVKC